MSRELALLEKLEKEINLKELQIKSLLTITQAINDNVPTHGLFNMYRSFLSWEMGIKRMILFIQKEDQWTAATHINADLENITDLVPLILPFNRLHTIKPEDPPSLRLFDIVIPVYHKKEPIAYALIDGIKDKEDLYNKIQFITTITNIIAVAIENKRLFKKEIQQERFKKEMELASEVQRMLIPEELPNGKNFEVAKIYQPHMNIGGDYLDFIKYDEHKFALCIADISGKGVAAALLMANFQAMLQSLIFQYRDLETFVFALNQGVYRITKSDKFITFFVTEIDTQKKTIKYVNAGHYPPLFYDGSKIIELKEGTTVIGAFEKLPTIQEGSLKWNKDAMLLCFTDGLVDLKNDDGEYFDDEMIKSFLTQNAKKTATGFNEALLKEIHRYKESQSFVDDIAILTTKLN